MDLSTEPVRDVSKPSRKPKQRFYVTIVCPYCKKEVIKRKDRIGKYCSSNCSNKSRINEKRSFPQMKTGFVGKCAQCGNDVYRQKSKLNHKGNFFCCKQCQHKFQSENPLPKGFISLIDNKGGKNGMYKHGKYCEQTIGSKVSLRKQIIERDGGHWCLLSGTPGPGLHLHRVIYGSQGGKYELNNCVLLSLEMHELAHSNKKFWKQILLDHLSGEKKIVNGVIPDYGYVSGLLP